MSCDARVNVAQRGSFRLLASPNRKYYTVISPVCSVQLALSTQVFKCCFSCRDCVRAFVGWRRRYIQLIYSNKAASKKRLPITPTARPRRTGHGKVDRGEESPQGKFYSQKVLRRDHIGCSRLRTLTLAMSRGSPTCTIHSMAESALTCLAGQTEWEEMPNCTFMDIAIM